MKILAIPLLLSLNVAIVLGQAGYNDLTTIKVESERFTDSLISAEVDTVISYYQGFAACPSTGRPWAFVYWMKNNVPSCLIFEQRTKIKKKKTIDTYELCYYSGAGMPSYSFTYFDKNFIKIAADSIIETYTIDKYYGIKITNYPFVRIRAKVSDKQIIYNVNLDRETKFESYKWELIKDLRSFVLNYYIWF